jgi:hypothetical protein
MKRVLMILAWTGGAYFGGGIVLAIIVGAVFGVVFAACYALHYDLHAFIAAHQAWGAVSKVIFRVVCALFSVAALILALRGRLPGTRIRHDSSV